MMPEQIENKMVIDALWEHTDAKEEEIINEKGFHELGTNNFVPEKEAYEYALDCCLNGTEQEQKEFKEMLVEWFFSGNWIREE